MNIESSVLSQFPELVHGFSTAAHGNMSYKKGDTQADGNNRSFYAELDINPNKYQIINPELRHGGNVAVVKSRLCRYGYTEVHKYSPEVIAFERGPQKYTPAKDAYKGIDACLSNSTGCLITIRPADCAPVFVYDPKRFAFGIIHASTSTLFSGIIERALNMMRGFFGSRCEDIVCYIGPGICASAYSLESTGLYQRVLHAELDPAEAAAYDPKKKVLNELEKCGIPAENIESSPICTASSNGTFFSNHASKGNDPRRMLAVIGLR